MVSEVASYPVSNNSIPLLYGVLPSISLICLEVFLSVISVKSKKFRTMIAGSALMPVRAGTIDQEQMKKARITMAVSYTHLDVYKRQKVHPRSLIITKHY